MDKISEVLTRGVQDILPSKEGLSKLMKKKKITLYQGFDPSSSSLHIGNLIGIRKLAQFQKLGHKVIFLIGDFTGMIGDPTDKSAARVKMTREQILENAKDYQKQIEKILDFEGKNKAEIMYNSEWLSKLTFEEIVEIASNFTVQQMLERDFFRERLKKDKPIYFHEFLYPLMQGYDCVVMNVDLEIGGSDQLFNMLAGRNLMKSLKGKEKYVLTLKLLTDPTGKKMGKSEGNTINLTDTPDQIYGKVMSLPDDLIDLGFELLTDLPKDSSREKKPMEAKKMLAFEIVSQIHGKEKASSSQKSFKKTFQEGQSAFDTKIPLQESFAKTIAPFTSKKSISDAKRYIAQGSVDINDSVVTDPSHELKVDDRLRIGKAVFGTVVKEK